MTEVDQDDRNGARSGWIQNIPGMWSQKDLLRHETRKDPKMTLKTLGLRNWKGWDAID